MSTPPPNGFQDETTKPATYAAADPEPHNLTPQPATPATPATPAVPVVPAVQPPQWAWAHPPAQAQWQETTPLEYHRLYHGVTGFRPWKTLLIVALSITFYLLFSLIVGGVWVVLLLSQHIQVFLASDPSAMLQLFKEQLTIDTQYPLSIVMGLLSAVIMIPSVWIALRIMGVGPLARTWSVALRIRWKLLFAATGLACGAVFIMNLAAITFQMLLAPPQQDALPDTDPSFDPRAALLSLVFVVLLVPFQATAEEVMFRGMLMQTIGSWSHHLGLTITLIVVYLAAAGTFFTVGGFKSFTNFMIISAVIGIISFAATLFTGSPFLPIAVSSFIFAIMHIYDMWGMLTVGCMGFISAWLTWRTGGLEAAIAIHVVNNLVAFTFLAMGAGGSTGQTEDTGGPAIALASAISLGFFAWITVIVFTRSRYGRTRIDLVETFPRISPSPAQMAPVEPVTGER